MTIALRQRPLPQVVRQIVQRDNGAWLDPSDMSTMYQDAAGTIPVTAVEQPVGLMLDKSRGMMLGPELVTNGTFDSGTAGWTGSAASVVNGELCVTATANYDAATQYSTIGALTVGKTYVLTATNARLGTSGGGFIRAGTGGWQATVNLSVAPKNVKIYFTATTTQLGVQLMQSSATLGTLYADNISVRELYGNHATQSITASRPTLSARKNILLATETLATQSVTTLAAQYTLSFTGTGSITLSGTATGTLTGTGAANRVSLTVTPTAGTLTLTVSGSVTKAQLELGTTAGPYQRVNTATDYDTDERYFPKYLRFDGIDDYMNLPYMGLYAAGSASVVINRSKIPAAVPGYSITETSSIADAPVYAFGIGGAAFMQEGALIRNDASSIIMDTRGDSSLVVAAPSFISSFIDDGTSVKRYLNSKNATTTPAARSGSLTLNRTTIGALSRTSITGHLPDNLYGLIITKAALTDSQRIACERYLGRKSGVQL